MQKNLTVAIALFLLLYAPILAHAQNESSLGIPPDSPFYFMQKTGERFKLIFTFDSLEKAKYQLQLIERRAEEIKYLAERGRLTVEKAIELQKKIEALINNARERLDQAIAGGRDARELIEKMQTILERQQKVLENVSLKVPDEAKAVIQKALEVSRRGRERVMELLNQRVSPSQ